MGLLHAAVSPDSRPRPAPRPISRTVHKVTRIDQRDWGHKQAMMRRLVPLATAALLLAGATTACGSSGSSDRKTAGGAASPSAKVPNVEELKKGLLTLSDMPTGYIEKRANEAGPSGSAAPEESAPPTSTEDACNRLFEQLNGEAGAGKTQGTVSAVFVKSEKGPIITHRVQSYRDVAVLRQDMATVKDAVSKCRHFTIKESDGTFRVGFATVSFPKLGDETEAFRVQATGPFGGHNATIGGYYVAVRVGNVVSTVSSVGLPTVPIGELETVARKATEKVTPIAT